MKLLDNQKIRFERFMRDRKYRLSVFGASPQFDWAVLIFGFLVCLVIVLSLGYLSYKILTDFNLKEEVQVENLNQINEEEVDNILMDFNKPERFVPTSVIEEVVNEAADETSDEAVVNDSEN